MGEEELRARFLDALYARDELAATKIANKLGEPVPMEFFDPEISDENITLENKLTEPNNTTKNQSGKVTKKIETKIIYISNKTTENELKEAIGNNVANKTYSIIIFKEPPKFKEYKLVKEDAFTYYNFHDASDAEGVKDINNNIIYNARVELNKELAMVTEDTKKETKFYFLNSITDKDGEIRPELPKITKKTASKVDCVDVLVEEGNFERPGLVLPQKEYEWKNKIVEAYNASNEN